MVYQGSKNRIAKYLIPIINNIISKNNIEYFFDMCMGGGNLSANSKHKINVSNIYGIDNNKYLIALLKKVQSSNIEYFSVTKEEYNNIKYNKNKYEDWYVGYVGFLQSFRSKFFDGYINSNIKGRNRVREMYNNLMKQKECFKDIKLLYKDIFNIDYSKFPKNSLIYFDPPYNNTTKYHNKFDTDKFWKLITELSRNFIVLVSEFNAPEEFESIWCKEKLSTLESKGKYKKDMEHLFVHKCNIDKII